MATQNYSDPAGQGDHELRAAPKFQVIAHVNPPDGDTELTARLPWPDEGSARSFATALLSNLRHGNFGQEGYRWWCEVWAPDETGALVDSARPGQQTGHVEWDSEIISEPDPITLLSQSWQSRPTLIRAAAKIIDANPTHCPPADQNRKRPITSHPHREGPHRPPRTGCAIDEAGTSP